MDNAWDIEKKDQHGFDIAANLTRFFFFGRREFGDFHCDGCCLVSGL
jgi:predicted unusual protein kinase regulating ubiquinone biosynthesis (AarF/ABC1/UbiB family)